MATNNLRRKNTSADADTQTPAQEVIFPAPQTELACVALEARRRYLASGETMLTLEEINEEVSARRGGELHVDE